MESTETTPEEMALDERVQHIEGEVAALRQDLARLRAAVAAISSRTEALDDDEHA